MDDRLIPILIVGLVVLILAKRGRQLMGSNRLIRPRQVLRIVFVGLALVFLVPIFVATKGLPVILGLVVGAGLGIWSAATTRFESIDGKLWYTPNPWIGLSVWLFFIGRLFYRWIRFGAIFVATDPGLEGLTRQFGSPWARASLFVLLAYYLSFSSAVLYRSRGLVADGSRSAPA